MERLIKSICVVVPKEKCASALKELQAANLIRVDLNLKKNASSVYIPVQKAIETIYEIREAEFESRESFKRNYKELVSIPERYKQNLPTSFDIVGRIAIIRLEKELKPFAKEIAEAILKSYKNISTVAIDRGVAGEYRLRNIEIIGGLNTTQTLHKEYGIKLFVDLKNVFFSPRLANERWTIANLVNDGEVVIDMFAGIGAFSVLIGKHKKKSKIYAIDINPSAIELLKKNIAFNKVTNVIPILSDARDAIQKIEPADRIIMNLPFASFVFFETALKNAKHNATIHYYECLSDTAVTARTKSLIEKATAQNKEIQLSTKRIKSYSATKSHYRIDMIVK